MNLHDWIDELCDALDLEDVEVDEGLLADLTRIAAKNVEHLAAPVTAYLLGVAAGARDAKPQQVEELAARAQALAEGWDRPAGAADPDEADVEVPDELPAGMVDEPVGEDDDVPTDEPADALAQDRV